jgi:hypothetical protein
MSRKFSFFGLDDCYFTTGKYYNGNLKIQIMSSSEGPVVTATCNVDVVLDNGLVAIKNWSENSGVDIFLMTEHIIEITPEFSIEVGYTSSPVYKLTEFGKEILGVI